MPLSLTRRTRRVLIAAPVVGAMLALAACGGGSGEKSTDGTIVIGYSGPLSGGAAAYGENVQAALELAVDQLNADGVTVSGKKYTVELKSLDDAYAPNTAATNAQRLAERDDAAVVFIPHAGGIQAAQELNSGRSEFLLAAYSSDPRIVKNGNPLTVMIPPSFTSYAGPATEKLMPKKGATLGLLGTASEYGQQWTNAITETWIDAGGEVLKNNAIDYGTVSDFAGPVAQTLADKPDTIFVGGPSQPTALIIEEARKQGYEGGFLVMDQAKFEEMELFTDPKNLNNSMGVKPAAKYTDPGTKGLLDTYAKEVSAERPVTSEVSLNFQTAAILVKAMEVAGTTADAAKIRAAIPEAIGKVSDVFKVTGFPTRITDAGHLINDDLDMAYRTADGSYEYVTIPQVDE